MTETNAPAPEAPAPPTPPPAPPTTAAPEPPDAPEPRDGSKRSGGVTAGIVLITIGVIFLAAQFLPGVAWFNLWPLIIVVAGLIQAFTPGREGWSVTKMFDGFVTVTIGLVFLAVTMGAVGWNVWWRVLTLWPVLLIALGLDLLGKALHTTWPRVLGSLVVMAALAFAVATQASATPSFTWMPSADAEPFSVSEPVLGTDEATLKLDAGVAQVTLGGGSDLIAAEGTSPWGEPEVSVDRSGSSADVQLTLGSSSEGPIVWPGSNTLEADVTLATDVVWDAVVSTGVSSLDGDLSDVDVRSLELKPGIADVDLKLGEVPTGV
ncbi:MAG: hypothetical protein FDZ75_00800, partial [Actinobacteria bacterium]